MIVDVVDCDKNVAGLENALKYFCGDKVVCLEDMDDYNNTLLLSQKGFKRVITLDGTSLSNGMFESGHHSNIFDKDLGKPKHDKDLKAKKEKLIKVLQNIESIRDKKGKLEESMSLGRKELISRETQIQILKEGFNSQVTVDTDRQFTAGKLEEELKTLQSELTEHFEERKDRNGKLTILQKDLDKVESSYFTDFCKKYKPQNPFFT
jgi:chromosome segregation ATPase